MPANVYQDIDVANITFDTGYSARDRVWVGYITLNRDYGIS